MIKQQKQTTAPCAIGSVIATAALAIRGHDAQPELWGIGPDPGQIDCSDYREVEGVKIAFRRTFTETDFANTIQIREFQQDVPINDSKIARPM